MKFEKKHIIGLVIAVLLIIVGLILFWTQMNIFYFILVIALVIATIPFILSGIADSRRQREIETKFLDFVRDLVENVRAGTPISKSIVIGKNND